MNKSKKDSAASVLLSNPRFEVIPLEGFNNSILELPDEATIAIPTSSQVGINKTIEAALHASWNGYEVIPHIAARYIKDEKHLESILDRISKAGITDIFVPAGDRNEPLGEFSCSVELLAKIDDLGYSFEEIGITGYPDGHHFLDKSSLVQSMNQKSSYATYITTQLCFSPSAIINWFKELKQRGIDLPVEIGIPGVMNYFRLWRVSLKIGVTGSVEFIRKNVGFMQLVRNCLQERGKYTPDKLIDRISDQLENLNRTIRGTHIYTFNQTKSTESWRQSRLKER